MAKIRPFRGLRYNPEKTADLSPLITQPYDRIGPVEQAAYYALHPHNFVRIELGLRRPDLPDDNVYSRASCYARTWLAESVMVQEERAALYVLDQAFSLPGGEMRTRRGLIAALELTRFDEGVVMPHEHTFSAPKADRLSLMRATRAAWSPIFVLHPDRESRVDRLLQSYVDRHASRVARELVIEPGVEQRFWVVDDAATVATIVEEMAPTRRMIIADGHHRYETALSYRDEMRAQYPEARPEAAFNYTLVTLVGMSDPGLVILPTHRLVLSPPGVSGGDLLRALQPYFEVTPLADRAALDRALAQAVPDHPRIGVYDGRHTLLTLRSLDAMDRLAPGRAAAWRALDVTILHEIVFEAVMGLSKDSPDYEDKIAYLRDAATGYGAVDRGEAEILFILNPTRIEQVRTCTEAGEKMPHKSTDFFPKIVSGLMALPLDENAAGQ